MRSLFNKLPPRPEYIVAVKTALEKGEELGLRDITRKTGLSRTQTISALESLTAIGEVESRRQPRATPTVLYRMAVRKT